ncbi:MAG: 4-hydroxy-tetrahydrodipicolinate reductase [Actinomycetota bacterium]
MVEIGVCIVGATGGVGRWLVRSVLESGEFWLAGAVARGSVGEDAGSAIGDDPCGTVVLGTIEEALERNPDVVVDYTHPSVGMRHVRAAIDRSIPVLIGTTGFSAAEFDELDEAARRSGVGLVTGNMSLTAALLQHLALITAAHIPHWTIVEYCKALKPDVPSGTARELAELMGKVRQPEYSLTVDQHFGDTRSLGADVAGSRVHAIRSPGISEAAVEVLFGLPGERLSLRHDCEDPRVFVAGSLLAAQRVSGFSGLVRGLDKLLLRRSTDTDWCRFPRWSRYRLESKLGLEIEACVMELLRI